MSRLKTTVYLDPDAYHRLKRIARSRGSSPAGLLREAVAEYVDRHDTAEMPRSVGSVRGGESDWADRAEQLLERFGES